MDGEQSETGWWAALMHPTRRGWTLIISGAVTLGLVAVAFLLPVPFVKLAPGPTFNVIGQEDGTDVITITGTETFPVSGNLDMTTVLESGGPRGGLTFVDAIASWLDPNDAVVPRELLFPDDVTGEEVRQRQAMLFSTSESNAVAAALTYLDRPVITQNVVTAVFEGTPADGVLLPKDEILSINGTEVTEVTQVAEAIRSEPIGTTFEIVVRRDGVEVDGVLKDDVEETVSVTSGDNPDDAGVPYIGIGVGEYYSAGFPIDFTLEDIGGPSAGLMFATGIVDKLTEENLAAGPAHRRNRHDRARRDRRTDRRHPSEAGRRPRRRRHAVPDAGGALRRGRRAHPRRTHGHAGGDADGRHRGDPGVHGRGDRAVVPG